MFTLNQVGPVSVGKILGILYAALGLIAGIIMTATSAFIPQEGLMGMIGIGAIIFLPIVYGIGGFIGGVISAFLYNLAAKWFGGIEFELKEKANTVVTPVSAQQ